jgi:hypothetical protein
MQNWKEVMHSADSKPHSTVIGRLGEYHAYGNKMQRRERRSGKCTSLVFARLIRQTLNYPGQNPARQGCRPQMKMSNNASESNVL